MHFSLIFYLNEVWFYFRLGEMDTQPPIMTFKAFLQSQDDNITDEEAIAKYAEYKLEFRRQQLNEFFVAHKEEEWLVSRSYILLCLTEESSFLFIYFFGC